MRNKKGQFIKGNIPWTKNHEHTEKSFEKMSETWFKKGECVSPNTEFKKGNEPIAPFKKGHIPWNKNKHIQTNNALAEWRKNGGQSWNKGMKFTYRPRGNSGGKIKKKCITCKKDFEVFPYRRNDKFCSRQCCWKSLKGDKRVRAHLKKISALGLKKQAEMNGPTSIEKKVYDELKKRGLLFETQKLINGKFLVDAYVPSLNLVIEADGDYWHSLEKVREKDKRENTYLVKCGFNLLRLSETEINNNSYKIKFDKGGVN